MVVHEAEEPACVFGWGIGVGDDDGFFGKALGVGGPELLLLGVGV